MLKHTAAKLDLSPLIEFASKCEYLKSKSAFSKCANNQIVFFAGDSCLARKFNFKVSSKNSKIELLPQCVELYSYSDATTSNPHNADKMPHHRGFLPTTNNLSGEISHGIFF